MRVAYRVDDRLLEIVVVVLRGLAL